MKKIIAVFLILILFTSCKKEDTSGCWQCIDALGNNLNSVCGDNEEDAFNQTGDINGQHNIETFRTYCHKQ